MKLVYLTAGAAGMFCGSCMHDNTLARALAKLGHDVQLIPLYTPIRTDEASFAKQKIFFGGVNVYLRQYVPLFRYLPTWMTRPLDQAWLLNWASQRSVKIKAAELGGITISMLEGERGAMREEVHRLVDWVVGEQPELVNFTNILVAASAPALRRRMNGRLVVTLQGDDIFLNDLLPAYREKAFGLIQRLAEPIDAFLVNSNYYAEYMSELLKLPREKFRVVPLGLDTTDFENAWLAETKPVDRPPTIGFLARLAPEKGLHLLAEAFLLLRKVPGCENARLRMAGWLGKQHQEYVDAIREKLAQSEAQDAVDVLPDVDRQGKLDFLRSIDVLSVPTIYREPKGIFVLESLAMGVPVVQPAHGAFPEVLDDLQGGLLVPPEDPQALAEALAKLILNPALRKELGERGRQKVLAERKRTCDGRCNDAGDDDIVIALITRLQPKSGYACRFFPVRREHFPEDSAVANAGDPRRLSDRVLDQRFLAVVLQPVRQARPQFLYSVGRLDLRAALGIGRDCLMVCEKGRGQPSDIGLHFGWAGTVILIAVVAIIGGSMIAVRHNFPMHTEPPAVPLFFYPFTLPERCLFVFMAFSAGYCEETVYRGFAISALKGRGWRTWQVVVLSTLSFIFIHGIMGMFMFPFLFVVGVFYGWLFLWRKSLTPCIYLHALFDVLAVMAI